MQQVARKYESQLRSGRAAATRAHVLAAARELFGEQVYTATSIKEIASRAGVSLHTVHATGVKAELMAAVLEREFLGVEGELFAEQAEVRDIFAEPDNDVALLRYTRFLAAGHSRIARLWHTALLAGDADPAIRAALRRSESARAAEIDVGSHVFVARGLVSEGERARFAVILTHLTDPESFHYFVIRNGWSAEDYAQWLLTSIRCHLDGPA